MPARVGPHLYFHTLRHLKPIQIGARLSFRLARPTPDRRPAPPLRPVTGRWMASAARRQSQFGPDLFRFLNQDGDLAGGWDDRPIEKLWRYNLHYFDDLNAEGADARSAWHSVLVARWIRENPPAIGSGWEPYPTSLRIVNWVKWALAGHALSGESTQSLAIQARWLTRRLERHLLGNHLFANAKALVFAGLFFEGAEAQAFMETGLAILDSEVDEQILPDGGHFELSPMYHAMALEDVLDLLNLVGAYRGTLPPRAATLAERLHERVASMRRWLAAMCHPDGEIAFFNDAAIGIAPAPAELDAYAARLGMPDLESGFTALTALPDSGYCRLAAGPAVAFLDVARIGPDYLPGHAHADTLSFELSVHGRRFLVNSGTSEYGTGSERLRQRGTAAHNTVVVAGEDSSEIWSAFRVGRRARPFDFEERQDDALVVACSHDGYRRLAGRSVHRRRWKMRDNRLTVTDHLAGGPQRAEARYHFHPTAAVTLREGGSGVAVLADVPPLRFDTEEAGARLEPSTWHREFGLSESSRCLVVPLADGRCRVTFRWNP